MKLNQREFKKWVYTLLQALAILGIGILAIFVTSIVEKAINGTKQELQPAVMETDLERKEKMKFVDIIPGGVSNTVDVNNGNKRSNDAEIELVVKGMFSDGYIYAVANVDGQSLNTSDQAWFDAIFVNLIELTKDGSKSEFGGHLIQAKSIPVPASATSTQFLYKLSDVIYKPTFTNSSAVEVHSDWLAVFNDKILREKILAFSSTPRGVGTIENLYIYYVCVDGSDCSISLKQ